MFESFVSKLKQCIPYLKIGFNMIIKGYWYTKLVIDTCIVLHQIKALFKNYKLKKERDDFA